MNCDEYVSGYLSAHADRELTREEEHLVVEHLGAGAEDGCAPCRARLAEEHLLKALIRRQAATASAPDELKARIRDALDQLDAESRPRPAAKGGGALGRELRRPRIWVPLAAACTIVVGLFIGSLPGVRSGALAPSEASSMAADAAFGQAESALGRFAGRKAFRPNVASGSLSQVATAYDAAGMPRKMWNFERAGFLLVGGRLDHLPDGTPVTYTLYHGANGDILNMRYGASDFAVPPGAVAEADGRRFYRDDGYSFCLTMSQPNRYIDVLVTREPIAELKRAVSTASLSSAGN